MPSERGISYCGAMDAYTVERSVAIDAPPEVVYARIVDFHRWIDWSPWENVDPDLQRSYSGSNSGAGAVYTWSGNRKVGEGRMEITEVTEPSQIKIALDFYKPFKASSITTFRLESDGSSTALTWTMTGPRSLAIKAMSLFKSMDNMVGPDLERGLAALKSVSENSDS